MRRRDFGSVRRLPSGRWQARHLSPSGERATAPETFPTRAAAAAYLAHAQTLLDRGGWTDPTPVTITFGAFAGAWLAERADLRPRTAELYTGLRARHLLPELGALELPRITTAQVRRWHAGRLQSGTGRSTVAKAYRLLKSILTTAVTDELLVRNPCVLRGAGAERTPERVPPTLPQA